MRYLVMECHPGYAVVLSDDGRFLKVANMRYQVGQTVTSIVEMHAPKAAEPPRKKHTRRLVTTLTAMAACLMLVMTGLFMNYLPYASVYMSINPEVRIDVNRRDMVVGVDGINTDGQDLLEGYDHSRKDLDLVMDELVDRAIHMGYLHEGGRITLTLDGDDKWIVSHDEELTEQLNQYLSEKITVTIDVEQKQPAPATSNPPAIPTVPTTPGGIIVIPVDPDDYDDSDYGETRPGESTAAPEHGDSDYGNDDGQTDYGPGSDDAQSDYISDSGDSAYSDSSDDSSGDSGYGDSGYGDSSYS